MAQTIVSSSFTDNRISLAVSHTSHGFTDPADIGKAVRSSGTDGQFIIARANTAVNSEVVGIITSIEGANNYTITTSGFVDVVAAVPTATAGTVFFLAEADDSQLTSTEPTTDSAISKPVAVITESNAKMLLIHYRGEVISSNVQTNAPNNATYVTTTANSTLTNEVLTSALKIDDFAAGDDNTDLDSSTSRHGLLRKLDNSTTNFLRGDGTWAAAGATDNSVRVTMSGAQSCANATSVTLLFGAETYDTDAFHDTGSNTGRLTCPSVALAGKYIVCLSVRFDGNTTGERIAYINHSADGVLAKLAVDATSNVNQETELAFSTIADLANGEYVTAIINQNSGGALNVASANTNFCMIRIA